MNQYTPQHLIKWLQSVIDKINELERQGLEAVETGDQDAYIAIMRAKAEALAALNDEAQPYLDEIDDDEALDYAERGFGAYSHNASKALDLNSVFYMSALLFPEEHQPGDRHNLEIFRDDLIEKLGL